MVVLEIAEHIITCLLKLLFSYSHVFFKKKLIILFLTLFINFDTNMCAILFAVITRKSLGTTIFYLVGPPPFCLLRKSRPAAFLYREVVKSLKFTFKTGSLGLRKFGFGFACCQLASLYHFLLLSTIFIKPCFWSLAFFWSATGDLDAFSSGSDLWLFFFVVSL